MLLHCLAFLQNIIKRTSNNLACTLQCFLCLFCARFALLKTRHLNRNFTKKGLKIESFLQKIAKVFFVFFLRPRPKSQILTPHPCPLFENFSVDTLNSEQKPFVKKPVDRPVNQRWFWNLPVGSRKSWPVPSLISAIVQSTLFSGLNLFVLIRSNWLVRSETA